MKRIIVLILVASLVIIICACSGQPTTINEGTSTPAMTPTPTLSPKPTTSPSPTPALFKIPEPVYVPREPLPAGQLFESNYYAILPGEGAHFNVFDCYGQLIHTFLFTKGEASLPIGLFTESELSWFTRLNSDEVQTFVPEINNQEEQNNFLVSTPNGFYQISRSESKSTVYLYNPAGKLIQTLNYTNQLNGHLETAVIVLGQETVIGFFENNFQQEGPSYSYDLYFVAADGKINGKLQTAGLSYGRVALLGRSYYLYPNGKSHDGSEWADLYDLDGKLIMTDVTIPAYTPSIGALEGNININFSEFYWHEGILYDSALQKVSRNAANADGSLIYGFQYEVQGVNCLADQTMDNYSMYFPFSKTQIVAVGQLGTQMAIKTSQKEYFFESDQTDFNSINQNFLILTDSPKQKTQIISTSTGEELLTVEDSGSSVFQTDEYILVKPTWLDPVLYQRIGFFIFDKNGQFRYGTGTSTAETTHGEYIVLRRGPYVGIADLNGEWILKSLNWKFSRDENIESQSPRQ